MRSKSGFELGKRAHRVVGRRWPLLVSIELLADYLRTVRSFAPNRIHLPAFRNLPTSSGSRKPTRRSTDSRRSYLALNVIDRRWSLKQPPFQLLQSRTSDQFGLSDRGSDAAERRKRTGPLGSCAGGGSLCIIRNHAISVQFSCKFRPLGVMVRLAKDTFKSCHRHNAKIIETPASFGQLSASTVACMTSHMALEKGFSRTQPTIRERWVRFDIVLLA